MLMVGCEQLLDVDSPRLKFEEDHRMSSATDTLYSMLDIFSHLQKVGDAYVLLGELRGEMMDVTSDANLDLQAINSFNIDSGNPYANISEYYAVINSCNYLITYIDTAFVSRGQHLMLPEFAAAKSIRAWTYMQIALNFGTAKYYENPITTLEDTKKTYPELDIYELADRLIPDLLPFKDTNIPSLGEIAEYNMAYSFFPIHMVLGDLYLWSGNYELAANEYHDLMYKRKYIISENYSSFWDVVNTEFINTTHRWWTIFGSSNSTELISSIVSSTEYGESSQLYNLSRVTHEITVSETAKKKWDEQLYFHDAASVKEGDLRGAVGSYDAVTLTTSTAGVITVSDFNQIYKFYDLSSVDYRRVKIYRVALLYLRYAEAVNRLGKPNLAFAVLKNGLNATNMRNEEIIPASETAESKPNYMNFDDVLFNDNVGIRSRGLGNVDQDTNYVIPAFISLEDSILYVEDLIVNELALETAFEGNRFQDLMRVSMRRNDPAYLADIVAKKYTGNVEEIRSKLMLPANWYLPQK